MASPNWVTLPTARCQTRTVEALPFENTDYIASKVNLCRNCIHNDPSERIRSAKASDHKKIVAMVYISGLHMVVTLGVVHVIFYVLL